MSPRRGVRVVVVALAFALTLSGAVLARRMAPGVSLESFVITDATGVRIPSLRIRPAAEREVRGHALLLHGVSASKETLVLLGEALALQGMDCVAVDFPGHGEDIERFGGSADLTETARAAARFISPHAPLDLVVGHSMGANVAAAALAAGELEAKLFISLGAAADPGVAQPSVFLVGRFEELVPASAVESVCRGNRLRHFFVSPFSDHVLEPFDPALVDQVVRAIHGTARSDAWLWRIFGICCLGLGFLLLVATGVPSGPYAKPVHGLAVGILVFLATAVVFAWAFGGCWLSAWPNAKRLAVETALILGSMLGFGLLAGIASVVPVLRRFPATAAQLVAIVCALPVLGLLLAVGSMFLAMCVGWGLLLLAGLAVIAATVEYRTRSRLAATIASGAFLGYFLGQWIPLVF